MAVGFQMFISTHAQNLLSSGPQWIYKHRDAQCSERNQEDEHVSTLWDFFRLAALLAHTPLRGQETCKDDERIVLTTMGQ